MILGILLVLAAWAGNEVNNGGHAVVCGKAAPKLLDYYEHAVESSLPGDYRLAVETLIAKLERVDTATGAQYRRRWKKWEDEHEMVKGKKLELIEDSFHSDVPTGCKLQQLAIRRQLVLGGQKRFVISQDIWNKMNAFHQAGLVLHELMHEHFTILGEKDSRKARAYNAYVAKMPEHGPKADYIKFVKTLKVPLYPR